MQALSCPFPVAPTHPQARELTLGCIEWARHQQLLPDDTEHTRALVSSYSSLAAHCYSYAPFERLAAICDYYSWLFYFDDACENLSLQGTNPREVLSLLTDVYAVLHGRESTSADPRFVTALSDVWQRIGPACHPSWRERLARHVECYIDGCVWEAQNRSLGRVPSRAVFETMRMHTSTMYQFWDFMEFAGGYFLPVEVVEHPLVAELSRTANAVASFANDVYSLQKESDNRDVHNLVLVLEHEEGLSREAACTRAAGLHDAQVRHFLELERRLPRFGPSIDAQLARYVEGMRIWLRANDDWSRTTARYNAPQLARTA
jgi:Terpene synthase family 2, C-terminal metal binding